jgi:circadian clock protein KaiC
VSDAAPPTVLPRLATGVPGLDGVLGGGLIAGDAYLVCGAPGTGKTTLGNQLAFAHAAAGGTALVATLLTESHERMLGHLGGLAFFDRALLGDRVRYLSLLRPLEEGGVDGLLEALRRAVREQGATLLVLDGAGAAEALAPSGFAFGRFVHGLQARAALLGCTSVLLASERADAVGGAGTHVDGIVELSLEPIDGRDGRWLRVAKLRGSGYLAGRHAFGIGAAGVEVAPRLEAALQATAPPALGRLGRVPTGVAGLDAMLQGGPLSGASTMVLGTPGAGKSILGMTFLAEGARRGEAGVYAGFHETQDAVVATAAGVGLDLATPVAAGLVRVLWRPPLELSPDRWAWDVLATLRETGARRLVIDAFTDLARLFASAERHVPFLTALANELRAMDATTLVNLELDAWAGDALLPPIPSVSSSMDYGVLLRTAEMGSRLERVISVLKSRQAGFDHAIRRFAIGADGITVGDPFDARSGLLVGQASPGADG